MRLEPKINISIPLIELGGFPDGSDGKESTSLNLAGFFSLANVIQYMDLKGIKLEEVLGSIQICSSYIK